MKKVLLQCSIILLPALIGIFYPIQKIFYGLLSLLTIDVTKFDEILKSIISNERIISIICGIIFSILIYIWRTKANKDKQFNTADKYNKYPIWVFWLASKGLGYGKVSLVRVPIYLQYKLLLKDTFHETLVDEVEEKVLPVVLTERNMDHDSKELNLVLIDTYNITDEQIPSDKIQLPTIIIKSGNEIDSNRSFNPEFIKEIRKKTHALSKNYIQLNVFSTTNTNHNTSIVNKCFKNGGRTGFKNVYVYQASRSNHVFNDSYKVL
ncbi:hypothetical protein [Terribacillus saccharophilus]|uniref:hypothetical protein n=1 Tax=Terribacillus saccharophilus TaxID=361277 RepID=UPI003981E692